MGITKEKLEKVVDTFESGFENFPDFAINMDLNYIRFEKRDKKWIPVCGCHAGFYGICSENVHPNERTNWKESAHKLANSLGFESSRKLQLWAKNNPEIWGNFYGYEMFYNELAIGGYFDPFYYCNDGFVINSEIILKHWVGVLERFEKYEEKSCQLTQRS